MEYTKVMEFPKRINENDSIHPTPRELLKVHFKTLNNSFKQSKGIAKLIVILFGYLNPILNWILILASIVNPIRENFKFR